MNQYYHNARYVILLEERKEKQFKNSVLNLAKIQCYLKKQRANDSFDYEKQILWFRKRRQLIKNKQDLINLSKIQEDKQVLILKMEQLTSKIRFKAFKQGFENIKQLSLSNKENQNHKYSSQLKGALKYSNKFNKIPKITKTTNFILQNNQCTHSFKKNKI